MEQQKPQIDIIKKEIKLDRTIANETTQILLEGDIIVPDIKPDVSLILQADSNVVIEKTEPTLDRINFTGKLNIQLLYLAKSGERPVHSMSITQPIEDFINMDGITKDTWVNLKADIANVEYTIINERKINYKALIDLNITGVTKDYHQVVTEIEGVPQAQQQRKVLNVSKSVATKNDRFAIKESLTVPSGKPSIAEILGTSVEIRNQDVRVTTGGVQITGELNVTTLYKGDDERLLDFMEHDIPFTSTVEMDEATEEMFGDATLTIFDKYIQVAQNDDGEDKVIDLEVSIGVNAKINTKEDMEFLEDAYSTLENLQIESETVTYPRFVVRNRNQNSIKEIVTLPAHCPDIVQVFKAKGRAILDEVKVLQDKVVAEGVIEADILYIAKSDDMPLFSYRTDLPYRQVIETPGTQPGMDVSVDISVDGIHFNMLSEREIELRVTTTFNTFVSENMQANIIKNIEIGEFDQDALDKMASITVYVVQKGDTLWKIAKRYHTSVNELVALNNLDSPDVISTGQKLIILKNAA